MSNKSVFEEGLNKAAEKLSAVNWNLLTPGGAFIQPAIGITAG